MKNLKQRLLTNWTFMRVIYLIMGVLMIIQSIILKQWGITLFGIYFASMGLFSFGCASGSCFGNSCTIENKPENPTQEVEFEEIKSK